MPWNKTNAIYSKLWKFHSCPTHYSLVCSLVFLQPTFWLCAYKLPETDTHLPPGKGLLGNIQTHVHCLSLNVTRVSPAVSDRSIYYPVYVKPGSVSWHGISVPWNIDGHHSLSIAFIPFCPFCSCDICFVVYLGKAMGSLKKKAQRRIYR